LDSLVAGGAEVIIHLGDVETTAVVDQLAGLADTQTDRLTFTTLDRT